LTKTDDALKVIGWIMQIARVLVRAVAEIVSYDVPPIGEVWERASDYYSKLRFTVSEITDKKAGNILDVRLMVLAQGCECIVRTTLSLALYASS